jgi:hypothetical protein
MESWRSCTYLPQPSHGILHLTAAAVMIMVGLMKITYSYIKWVAILHIQEGGGADSNLSS